MIATPYTHACEPCVPPDLIARLSDAFRQGGGAGKLAVTAGVIALGRRALPDILEQVRAFSAFTPDNDPHGEHDFGSFEWDGHRLFWKLDHYDAEMRFGSPDPADPTVTTRVLTIMLAAEW